MAANIALTAAKIAMVDPTKCEVWPRIAAATITAGQALYETSTGTVGVADATTGGGLYQFYGIALTGGASGAAIDVLLRGHVYGFTVSSTNCGTVLHLSETAGTLADAAPAGTGTAVHCGLVTALSDATPTRIVWIDGPAMV